MYSVKSYSKTIASIASFPSSKKRRRLFRKAISSCGNLVAIIVIGLFIGCSSVQGQGDAAEAPTIEYKMFICAIESHSNEPNYVLVTIVDSQSARARQVAVLVNLLQGAIHLEYGLPFTDEGIQQADKIARATRDLRFVFHRDSALANLGVSYSPEILAEVESKIGTMNTQEIIAGLKMPPNWSDTVRTLHDVYLKQPSTRLAFAYRAALAHVLLERHVFCGVSDMTGQLFVEKRRCADM